MAEMNPIPTNTISAEPVTSLIPDNVCKLVHDTIKVEGPRDTIHVEKIVHKTKYRTKRVVHTVERVDTVEVPVLYTSTRGTRKEISPDTLLAPNHKRVNRKVIELND